MREETRRGGEENNIKPSIKQKKGKKGGNHHTPVT
jgi:hypothetical protein